MLTPETYLDGSDSTARVMAHVRLLLKLGRRFAAAAPPGLAGQARVVNYRMGIVVIHANNGAVAAKLNQSKLRLRDSFVKIGVECNDIEVKVQPEQRPGCEMQPSVKPISGESARQLVEQAEALPKDSPLGKALRNLVARAAIRE